jgi:alpha-galactosidase
VVEHSAEFEWAAWQFNRPEEGDGMVQVFRRDKSEELTRDLRLRGLDAAATYEVTNVDTVAPRIISGTHLMRQGLYVEIPAKPGSAILFYKKAQPSLPQ